MADDQEADSGSWLESLKSLVHLNFYRIHLLYFICTILITSAILCGSSTSSFKITYIDALYLCTSAICNVGLNSVNISNLNGFQQSVLFVLMFMGDLTTVTISVVLVRRYFFGKRMSKLVQESGAARRVAEDIEEQDSRHHGNSQSLSERQRSPPSRARRTQPDPERKPSRPRQQQQHLLSGSHLSGYGSFPAPWHSKQWNDLTTRLASGTRGAEAHYLSFPPQLDHKVRE